MCGIVGLFLKNPALRSSLGGHFATMLASMGERGPDSAGIAVYQAEPRGRASRVTAFHPDAGYSWESVAAELSRRLTVEVGVVVKADHAVLEADHDVSGVTRGLTDLDPDIRIVGYGKSVAVFKDKGSVAEIVARYGVTDMAGSHAIGHTRMATESDVTTGHSHPFIADDDVCLVHNGSLSNHNRLRGWLIRQGMQFETDNDTEVAARYVAHRLQQGSDLKEALEAGLRDLDGFFTFAIGTRTGFAVLRDGFACKPAVLAETGDWVAMASEFRSLAELPGVEQADIWEPEPEVVYDWTLGPGA